MAFALAVEGPMAEVIVVEPKKEKKKSKLIHTEGRHQITQWNTKTVHTSSQMAVG